jgi:glycosyltransferase involved in cell wall biosynthesis
MAPTVSVLIPTYNRSGLIVNALESVLAQTYKDYEVIVVDDGSTDDTTQKLQPYRERIRYVYQENRGVSAALNKGINVARGKWLSVLASDDVWLATKLERQFQALHTLGNGFGACFTDCTYHGDPTLSLSAFQQAGLRSRTEFSALDDPVKYVLARYPAIYVQSLLVQRSLLEELEGFDETMVVAEDTDLLFRLTFKTRLCFAAAPLVRIDRTPDRPVGLMEIFSNRDDRGFACMERMWKKWLTLPELEDLETRQYIRESMRHMYYNWAIARLYQLRLMGALGKMNDLRAMGEDSVTIAETLGARAARKLRRLVRGQ